MSFYSFILSFFPLSSLKEVKETSHGPVGGKRHDELSHLLKACKVGLVYVTAFPTRTEMARYLSEISWEPEVWVNARLRPGAAGRGHPAERQYHSESRRSMRSTVSISCARIYWPSRSKRTANQEVSATAAPASYPGYTGQVDIERITMRVRKITVYRDELANLDMEVRRFFLLAGHIQNEIVTFNKIFSWCISQSSEDKVAAQASMLQGLIIGKTYAGKLREAWQAINVAYFKSALSREYDPKLPDQASEALSQLKRYFNQKNNVVFNVRNNYSFHYSPDVFEKQWELASQQTGFELLIGPNYGNTLHKASEYVANISLLDSICPGNIEQAFGTLLHEVQTVGSYFSDFLDGFLYLVLNEHIVGFHDSSNDIEVEPVAKWQQMHIPFFVDIDADQPNSGFNTDAGKAHAG